MILRVQAWFANIRDWITSRFRNARDWLSKPQTQAWLTNIGAGAFILGLGFVFTLDGHLLLKSLTFLIALLCGCFTLPLNWKRAQRLGKFTISFIRNYLIIILIMILVVGIALYVEYRMLNRNLLPDIPERQIVAEIQYSLSKGGIKRWFAEVSDSSESRKVFSLRDYELIEAENVDDPVIRIYIENGKRIAEDARAPGPYSFSRKYYRDDCHFATDYFDDSKRCVTTEYRENCKAEPKIFDCRSPVLFPPVPVFMYR